MYLCTWYRLPFHKHLEFYESSSPSQSIRGELMRALKGCLNRKRDQAWFSRSLTDDPDLWLPQLLQQPAVIFRKTSTAALREGRVEFVISGWDTRKEGLNLFHHFLVCVWEEGRKNYVNTEHSLIKLREGKTVNNVLSLYEECTKIPNKKTLLTAM